MPKVSVILPVYNGSATVGDAIDSILSQTFSEWELIVIDDGSADNSIEVIETYVTTDPRIQLYKNETNRGLASTMNRGHELSNGEYIAVQEQDDMSIPNRLELEVNCLDNNPDVALVSGLAEWLNDDMERKKLFPGLLAYGYEYPKEPKAMFEYLYINQCKVVNAGCMYRRLVFEELDIHYNATARMSIDWEFFLRVSRHYGIIGLHDIVVRMRRGDGNASLTTQKKLLYAEARRVIREMREEFKDGPEPRVSWNLWRKAMMTQLIIETRVYSFSGIRMLPPLAHALILCPWCPELWKTILWIARRAFNKLTRLPMKQTS